MKVDISIIIPFYNNYDYLIRALNSVFKQSYKKYEVIIINDNPSNNKIFNITKNLKN